MRGHLSVRQFAEALDVDINAARGLLDRGLVAYTSFGPKTKRWIPLSELRRLRSLGYVMQDVQDMQDSRPERENSTVEA